MDITTFCLLGRRDLTHSHQYVARPDGRRIAIFEDLAENAAPLPVLASLSSFADMPPQFATLAEAFAALLPGAEIPAVDCRAARGNLTKAPR